MTTAAWLQTYLELVGLWNTDGIGRAARGRRCRTCREYILVGLDADRCALPVAVDPDPLSRLGEAAALLAGRSTFSLRFLSGRLELDHRGHFEIRGELKRFDVLALHVCGEPSIGLAVRMGTDSRLDPLAPRIAIVEF